MDIRAQTHAKGSGAISVNLECRPAQSAVCWQKETNAVIPTEMNEKFNVKGTSEKKSKKQKKQA